MQKLFPVLFISKKQRRVRSLGSSHDAMFPEHQVARRSAFHRIICFAD
ncbi:MAG: hypothetical protein JZU65_09765 [Chlorobium sp.]|jgi:hypothetical protein|nr:hypothetical protein [Chlorobium sp.]